MAIEAKRGCGYRKVGGLYVVSGGIGLPCCKLPVLLKICPCCGNGIKQTRGWTWIDPKQWLKGDCTDVARASLCPAANPEAYGKRVGLLWVGTQFYPTPESFAQEAQEMGVSRRINSIPRGFEIGRDWIFFAHPKVKQEVDPETNKTVWVPGIFHVCKPTKIEKIVKQSDADLAFDLASQRAASKDEKWEPALPAHKKLLAAWDWACRSKVTWVPVPDDDKDHQGSVYDKPEKETEDELELA